MSIWYRISQALAALAAGESLAEVFQRLKSPPEQSAGFTIAVIALGAKMAKADGTVTRNEVRAFREVFHIPRAQEENAAKIFNLARQDVAGFELYAEKIYKMLSNKPAVLYDLLEGLFHIAIADNSFEEEENHFLEVVRKIFKVNDQQFRILSARFIPNQILDPYAVLGIEQETPTSDIEKVWKKHIFETHPDRMQARGVPVEAVKLAEKRLIQINEAWGKIKKERAI
ncbi:MAG: molecular chaperone DjiA [Paracoccaceae bacterium]|jgi:DnaJ like chaperone protein|nr:molecular chaperone DjiA [Paracoccaceae bacterium]|tara:strand:- start:958 stop:1641 length:684 start_codon:yes stop_codon:yes gene_type:complete